MLCIFSGILDSDGNGLLDANESDHDDENPDGLTDTADDASRTILAVIGSGLASDFDGSPRNIDADALADFRDGAVVAATSGV